MQRPGYRRRPAPLPSLSPTPSHGPQQDLPEVTRSAAVVIAAAPLDVPEEADPESPDAAPPPARHRLMTYRRGGIGFIRRNVGRGRHQGPRRLEPPVRQPPCARPGKVECAGSPAAGTAP